MAEVARAHVPPSGDEWEGVRCGAFRELRPIESATGRVAGNSLPDGRGSAKPAMRHPGAMPRSAIPLDHNSEGPQYASTRRPVSPATRAAMESTSAGDRGVTLGSAGRRATVYTCTRSIRPPA